MRGSSLFFVVQISLNNFLRFLFCFVFMIHSKPLVSSSTCTLCNRITPFRERISVHVTHQPCMYLTNYGSSDSTLSAWAPLLGYLGIILFLTPCGFLLLLSRPQTNSELVGYIRINATLVTMVVPSYIFYIIDTDHESTSSAGGLVLQFSPGIQREKRHASRQRKAPHP